mgnify:FL=1
MDDPNSRPWALSLLKNNISGSTIEYFQTHILPLSQQVLKKSQISHTQKKQLEAKNYHFIYLQLWALLPGFLTLPTDAKKVYFLLLFYLSKNL